jgi:LuxR family transcriptional regulator, quorum-sensing system regulator CciR
MSRLDDVNAFITQSRSCRTADDLRRLMEGITLEMGFHSYALYQYVRQFSWTNQHLLAISNYPRCWLEQYFERKLEFYDPVMVASSRTCVGFRFADLPTLIRVTDPQRRLMEQARGEGISDGFSVPAHIPGERHGTCTFAVNGDAPLPERSLPMAQIVGVFAYESARRIQLGVGPMTGVGPKLSPRQLECVLLIARGKTDWEIARILGLARETVRQHVQNARVMYGVSRRTELVVQAIYNNDLSLTDIIH